MAYATIEDVQLRMTRALSETEVSVGTALLNDIAALIDATSTSASDSVKLVVSCNAVKRALGDGDSMGVPAGATQGSMSGLGYSQSWTIGTGGSVGELYLSKTDKKLLGLSNAIGSYSPIEELVPTEDE